MPRDYKLYLEDILEAIAKIQQYTEGLSVEMLSSDSTLTGHPDPSILRHRPGAVAQWPVMIYSRLASHTSASVAWMLK